MVCKKSRQTGWQGTRAFVPQHSRSLCLAPLAAARSMRFAPYCPTRPPENLFCNFFNFKKTQEFFLKFHRQTFGHLKSCLYIWTDISYCLLLL
jgi:hypothetical protein